MNLETFYKKKQWYWVTINPADKYQYLGHQLRQELFKKFICEHIVGNMICDFHFVIEYSEPRGNMVKSYSGPRLHIHGLIKFNSRSTVGHFLDRGMYKILRTSVIDIDTPKNISDCIDYMYKQKILKREYSVISNVCKNCISSEGAQAGPSCEGCNHA